MGPLHSPGAILKLTFMHNKKCKNYFFIPKEKKSFKKKQKERMNEKNLFSRKNGMIEFESAGVF